MLSNVRRKFGMLKYRLQIRNALQGVDREMLQINLEEVKKEIERRNKK